MNKKNFYKKLTLIIILLFIATILGLFTSFQYIKARGLDYFENGNQILRHLAVLEGKAGNPWQYRVLSPYLLSIFMKCLLNLNIPNHITVSFILFRIIQDIIIFFLFFIYVKKLGLTLPYSLIGMAILAWGISYSHHDSDLQFNTFFDIIFYLLAGICILEKKFIWIIPIIILGALNRETSGLIPFLLIFASLFVKQNESLNKVLPIFVIALLIYFFIFIYLRICFSEQKLFIPYGHTPGIDLLKFNLLRIITYRQLIATLSIIPVVAIMGYNKWPSQLHVFFWVIVPIWFLVHAFSAVMAETRLFLVPQAMVFIPGALFTLERYKSLEIKTK